MADDKQKIKEGVQLYFDSMYESDPAKVREAFYPNAMITGYLDTGLAERMFGTCLDAGINFFDNAEGYERGESEVVMGKALKALDRSRDSYCVSSKVFFGAKANPLPTQIGLSRKHITEACHQAMQRLQVDYLDMYFCHRADPETPISETVWAMHNLVMQGKVLYWGTSEWTAEQIAEAYEFAYSNHLTPPSMGAASIQLIR